MAQSLPITDLPRALINGGYEPANYRRVYEAAVSGTIPAQRGPNGRWTFDLQDLAEIAQALGLTQAYAA